MKAKGWCPGALRPMPAGDGYLLRLRPRASRLSALQVTEVAALAREFGTSAIDLGSRGSLQLRGIRTEGLARLQDRLGAIGLLDASPELEARRNILMSPLWQTDDQSLALCALVEEVLREAPDLPAKFGYAIDTGQQACLQAASADLRLELCAEGLLILRADGMAQGEAVSIEHLAAKLMELLHWFERSGCKRMAEAVSQGQLPPLKAERTPRRQVPRAELFAGLPLLFSAFGASSSTAFEELAGRGLRLTPWRAVLPDEPICAPRHWITDASHSILRVDACPGRPSCAAASVETRILADQLARRLHPRQTLHVSGCAKGCAKSGAATLTLVGREGRFDVVLNGKASDPPRLRNVTPDNILSSLGGHLAPPL